MIQLELEAVPRAGKQSNGAKRGKQNNPPMRSAGKHVTVAKRGKTCNRRQARENISQVPSLDWLSWLCFFCS